MEMNTAKPPRIGIMQKLFVYEKEDGALLGSGWIITRDDGKHMAPDLIDLKGDRLPEAWYMLKVTDEYHIVIIPRMIQ